MSHHPQPHSAKLLLWLPMAGIIVLMIIMNYGATHMSLPW